MYETELLDDAWLPELEADPFAVAEESSPYSISEESYDEIYRSPHSGIRNHESLYPTYGTGSKGSTLRWTHPKSGGRILLPEPPTGTDELVETLAGLPDTNVAPADLDERIRVADDWRNVSIRILGNYTSVYYGYRGWYLTPRARTQPITRDRDSYRDQGDRKAAGTLFRKILANDLGILWTLTFSEPVSDWNVMSDHLTRFWRRLNYRLERRVPYLAIGAPHEKRTCPEGKPALHIHAATAEDLDQELLQQTWGEGFIHPGDPAKADPLRLAGYMRRNLFQAAAVRPDGRMRYAASRGLEEQTGATQHLRILNPDCLGVVLANLGGELVSEQESRSELWAGRSLLLRRG